MARKLAVAVVCRVLGASRSTIYARRVGAADPGTAGAGDLNQ